MSGAKFCGVWSSCSWRGLISEKRHQVTSEANRNRVLEGTCVRTCEGYASRAHQPYDESTSVRIHMHSEGIGNCEGMECNVWVEVGQSSDSVHICCGKGLAWECKLSWISRDLKRDSDLPPEPHGVCVLWGWVNLWLSKQEIPCYHRVVCVFFFSFSYINK